MTNKRIQAKAAAIKYWRKQWGLTEVQACSKFLQQDSKWRKRQVNKFLKELQDGIS